MIGREWVLYYLKRIEKDQRVVERARIIIQ